MHLTTTALITAITLALRQAVRRNTEMSLHSHEISRFWLGKGMWISHTRLSRAFRGGQDFRMKRASAMELLGEG